MAEYTEMISVAEVATIIKTTNLNVMMHIKRGLLSGTEINGIWYVSPDSLTKFLNQSDGAMAGSLCKSSCNEGCSSCG